MPRKRILVVDDHVDAAHSLGMLLRQMGHDVQVVHDGHAALEAARLNRPQVVLLDLSMPGVHGVSGLLYVYYHKYIHPTSLSITSSAEALLGVIAGGSGTLGGPVVGAAVVLLLKNYVSAYLDRWNMLLGLVFLFIVLVVPTGIVPGLSRLATGLRRGSR